MSKPILMENTKIHTFSRYNEKVYKRNERFYRIVPNNELTPSMFKSAGMSPLKSKEAPKPKADPEPTQLNPNPYAIPNLPDMEGWDEEDFRKFAQDHDIPYHPMAKATGLRKAIERFYQNPLPPDEDE